MSLILASTLQIHIIEIEQAILEQHPSKADITDKQASRQTY